MYDNLSRVIEVNIDEILPNRFQPRIQFDEEEILELSDSIREHGVIQPIVVRAIGDKYEIIAGERRYKASVLAGKESVPVIVKNLNDKDSAELALIENIQRKNLTPIEEALSYKKILDMGYLTQENLATKLGKSQSAVANKIRLLNLSDEVQEALLENKISERHARSLLKLSTSKLQNEMLNRIVTERLTVRKTDEEIEKIKNNPSAESSPGEQKTKEKGEIDMNNNNMFGMPNIPQNEQTTPSFDIFGGSTPIAPQPMAMEETSTPVVPNLPVMDGLQFDANGIVTQPQTAVQVEEPQMNNLNPVIQPMAMEKTSTPVVPNLPVMDGLQFDANGIVTQPQTAVQVEEPQMNNLNPVIQPMAMEKTSTPVVPNLPVMDGLQFDANGIVTQPQAPVQIEEPQMNNLNPVIQPMAMEETPTPVVPNVPVMDGLQFDANGIVTQPQAPVQIEEPQMNNLNPVIQPMAMEETPTPVVPNIPVIDGLQFDANGTITESQPMSLIEDAIPSIPQTAPIMESPAIDNNNQMTQQSENLFSFGDNNLNSTEVSTPQEASIPEFKMPEPIIVTDYSKQYDPVMPQTLEEIKPTVDFKEVINAIRECSNKIEQYGFKIDVEEYDLANLYQVIFKIEK